MALEISAALYEQAAQLDAELADFAAETLEWRTNRGQTYDLCLRQAKDLSTFAVGAQTLREREGEILRSNGDLVIGRPTEPVNQSIQMKEYAGTWLYSLSLKSLLREADAAPSRALMQAKGHPYQRFDKHGNLYTLEGVEVRDPETLLFFKRYIGYGDETAPEARKLEHVKLIITRTHPRTNTRSYSLLGIPIEHQRRTTEFTLAERTLREYDAHAATLRHIAKSIEGLSLKRKRVCDYERTWKYPRLEVGEKKMDE